MVVTPKPRRVPTLRKRLDDNAAVLLAAYRECAVELERGRGVEPAAEWLLDNYHVVEEQVRQVRDDLSPGFYLQLPKLAEGPFAGYPRVLGVAWAFVAHTDSNFDPESLRGFVAAYQSVQALTIGELWAVAVTVRIVMLENLRRLAEEMSSGRRARDSADELADTLLTAARPNGVQGLDAWRRTTGPLSEIFAAQLSMRLRDKDPRETPALAWLRERLAEQGSSADEVVEHVQQRQGASNVSVRNVITSMRLISGIDWADWFESVSLADERLRKFSAFGEMDFTTRDLYRKEIEHLARGSSLTELQVAQAALDATATVTATAVNGGDEQNSVRMNDPGYHLIAQGRPALEARIGYVAPWSVRAGRWATRSGMAGYVGAILGIAAVVTGVALWALWALLAASGQASSLAPLADDARTGTHWGWLALFLLLALLPATELATALLNRVVAWKFRASPLPAVDLTQNVPESCRTLVAVPTILTSEAEMLAHVEQLEVHYLSGAGGDLVYALLTDGPDADQPTIPADAAILAAGAAAIAKLNARHGLAPAGSRFLLLNRRRLHNAAEGKWMGWERKRGKLHELNRLLRGATDTSYTPIAGLAQQLPRNVRYVLTLDADTRLPRDAAQKLIGKMAHPLNRPIFDSALQRVVEGHGILQPRVTPSLPLHRGGSVYQRLFSSPAGLDPYAAAVSDVYQDLFGEGSYTGKGIYDIDAFEAALAGRVPDNTMLSHDLFEGVFARAGLVSDIEVVEEFPSRYDVASRRTHRWVRGDWQLLPWLFGRQAGKGALPPVGRGKMLDNLRRSLLAPATFLAFGAAWMMPLPMAGVAVLFLLVCHAAPAVLASLDFATARRSGVTLRHRAALLGQDLSLALQQELAAIAFLADNALKMADAIIRTLWRLGVSRRHLLEWTTAAQSAGTLRSGVAGAYRAMWQGVGLGMVVTVGVLLLRPANWMLVLPFALSWLAAPALAWWVSRPRARPSRLRISPATALSLRRTARRTWRYFETFVTADDHMLPPDNFQETPRPALARRTSPTNIGMYLLSVVAARDLGWLGTGRAVSRIEETLATTCKLERYNGHLFNWYATDDLRVLAPAYVSTVDSGNLAGHLIAVANACEQWADDATAVDARPGLRDDLALAFEALGQNRAPGDERFQQLMAALQEMEAMLKGTQEMATVLPALGRLATKAARSAQALMPVQADGYGSDLCFWTEALATAVQEHRDDLERYSESHDTDSALLGARLRTVADQARALALGMEFAFLMDPERKLFSIGYSLAENRRDSSCYDLLASEARLASLFAIAKGDVPSRHWLRLGRVATLVEGGSALISWSGSMFEYLMPSLVLRAPVGSLLEQTNRIVVQRQRQYAAGLGLPWGCSESAYNARDVTFAYQYLNFGIPGLGLKRGLSEDRVVAPYATGLAAMVDPEAARENFGRLARLGALGRYGFHEALDFTPARLREEESVAIVRSFMAHHQGMTIAAIANALLEGRLCEYFHRESMIQACEALLQERVPRDTAVAHPRAEEVRASTLPVGGFISAMRRFDGLPAGPPHTHLLSNGRYTVMLTASGGGYSRWGEIAVTRWHADPTRDHAGSYLFLRDMQRDDAWSATPGPVGTRLDEVRIELSEDRADFMRRDGSLTTTMQVLVSGESDGEVRRVSLVNSGRRAREIELTSYAELVLATPAADRAHPAFSKMFVITEFLPEFGALVATRRRRSLDEPSVWAAHFAVIEGEEIAPVQYETDRARCAARQGAGCPPADVLQGAPLSNTVGTVLDPVFSLRHSVRIAAGRVVRVSFWTMVADTREALLDLIDKHHDRSAFDRAETLAWTQAQVQLRHLGMQAEEAAAFQRLAAPLLYPDSRFRPPSAAIIGGLGSQAGLWQYGISGDLPIVLLRIGDVQDMPLVLQMLRAHEYWRMKRLAVDLVILNERASSYVQDLQNAIDTAVRSSQTRPSFGEELAKGAVYTLRADLMAGHGRGLIQSAARIVLLAVHGTVADQLARILDASPRPDLVRRPAVWPAATVPMEIPSRPELEFFNGLGGFDRDGQEYVIHLTHGTRTPAPWINVIANPHFGFQVSAEGSGYTWSENSKENQLTPWSNDPVMDPPGEVFYVRDEATGELWTPTALPIRDEGDYVARHGFGYSRFEHRHADIASELLQYVAARDPIKISRLTLTNHADRKRTLSVTAYVEWVLGTARSVSAPFLVTQMDDATGALFAANPWRQAATQRMAFADLNGHQTAWTADRREFLGDNGDLAMPAALAGSDALSGRCGAALDPCGALQTIVDLQPGQSVEVVFFLGECDSAREAQALIRRYRRLDLDQVFAQVVAEWRGRLGTVQVKTPDRAMDIMLNGWLLYQTISCRLWARSAFYQASGAYGFRDQLQDTMALMFAMPDAARAQLLRAASRQFIEGDVQHWWLPPSGMGVRTRISDDRVWLAYAAGSYVRHSGDAGVLDEPVAFLEGPALAPHEHDIFFQPTTGEHASLFEHCALGLDQCIALTGAHGLPLMGTGDWNDGMNRVGQAGRGESVWLGWLLLSAIDLFMPLARVRDPGRAARWRAHADGLRVAMETHAWDGEWYRRATFDDGTWLGSAGSPECRIDAIAQSWAVLSGAARPERAALAMASLDRHLVRREDGLALLFAPPFDRSDRDPGYIMGYPPGLRENGGQYTHAASWTVLAYAKMGEGDKAAELFSMLNPVNHASTPSEVARYKVEPYVVAADIYSVAPHIGRGGWTWYTGSAGWMYRAALEGLLGIQRVGTCLSVNPCIPRAWPGFEASIDVQGTHYEIRVDNAAGAGRGVTAASMDDAALACTLGDVSLPLDGQRHSVVITL
nr:glucoamylase family protein [Bordetella sp. LUAb4]